MWGAESDAGDTGGNLGGRGQLVDDSGFWRRGRRGVVLRANGSSIVALAAEAPNLNNLLTYFPCFSTQDWLSM
jgi:hypothetical protein